MRSLSFVPFCLLALQATAVLGETLSWNLVGVEFTNGTHATGSFDYNADTNSVSNVDIVTDLATFTTQATTFPVEPFEFAFVPSVPLVFGAKIQALLLLPSPELTDAGGTVALCCSNGFSSNGLICSDACDSINAGQGIEAGVLTTQSAISGVPEPSFVPILTVTSLLLVSLCEGKRSRARNRKA